MSDEGGGGSAFDKLLRKSADVPDATESTSESIRSLYDALNAPKPTHIGTVASGPRFEKADSPSGSPDLVLVIAMSSLVVTRAIQLYKQRQRRRESE